MMLKKLFFVLAVTALATLSANTLAEIKPGDKLQTLANLHPDMAKNLIYTLNYQLSNSLIPVCSEITIKKVKKKTLQFEWNKVLFTLKWEGFTKKAGISMMTVAENFFGEKCDKNKISAMSKLDQEGIREGVAKTGMTREGILIAMGRPPYHANPSLEASTFVYWLNRFKKQAIDFNDKGVVTDVRL